MANEIQLKIAELFYSIQGESSFAGYPCFFIRFADCNLRCSYCDSPYVYEEEHPFYSIAYILAELKKYPSAIVEVTGGEPLLQPGVNHLLHELLATGRRVLLETNGSLNLADVPEDVVKIMDLKCPGSGMHDKMDFDNFDHLSQNDEIKFVLSSREDYDWAVTIISLHNLQDISTLTFSPVISQLPARTLAEWMLQDHLPVRLRLQLHTVIWPEKTRGY